MAASPNPHRTERLITALSLSLVVAIILLRGWQQPTPLAVAAASITTPVVTATPSPTATPTPVVQQIIAVPVRKIGSNTIASCQPKWVFTGQVYQELVFVLYADTSSADVATQVTSPKPHPITISCHIG